MTWQGVNTKDLAGGSGDFHQGLWNRKGLIFMSWTRKRKPPVTPHKPLMSLVSRSLWSYGKKFSSVAQSCPTLCHPMDGRPPCPSPTPGVHSNSCLLSRWCHATISSSVIPFSSCLQSFPASGSFQMSQFFTSGGQSIGVSASASSPSNEYSELISFRIN